MGLLRRLVRVAQQHPETRKHLVPVIRKHLGSWEPGEVIEDGYETGTVVHREHDDLGIGSQVPPAHDHKGRPLSAQALQMPVNRSLHRAQVAVEKELPAVAAAVQRKLRDNHGPIKIASMALSLDPQKRMWVACGKHNKGATPYQVTGRYYGEIAGRFMWVRPQSPMPRTAGDVRFIKDKSGDKETWGFNDYAGERNLTPDYEYEPDNARPLAKVLRSTLASLGHAMSAYTEFTKIKSKDISPDGQLGGLGYVAKIPTMRQQYMNAIEAMSAMSDTLYDEVHAPHWNPALNTDGSRERVTVKEILQDVDEIREDPEEWAEEEEAEMDAENAKQARAQKAKKTTRRPGRRKDTR